MKKNIYDKIKQYGILAALPLAVKAVIRIIFKVSWHSSYLMCQRLSIFEQKMSDDVIGNNIQIKRLELSDLHDGYCRNYFNDKKIEIFKERLKNPLMEGYGLFVNGDLACYEWVNYDKFEITSNISLPLSPKSALLFDDFCHPDFRRKGFHTLLSYYRIKRCMENNMENAFVLVHIYNKPAIKTQHKCGFKVIRRFSVFKIGAKERCTLKSVDINLQDKT
jgi:GNAT superfamily N-acetyltransferase